ncbi:MAG TPA: coenzyme F420-0:L-glutamate ligase [Nitrososphaera sp.]|nr:coenzyme F420-0:L-glutamate ligase [Nitrososphaera sp.]
MIQIIPVRISADIKPHDDLGAIILKAAGSEIQDGDVLVVAHKIVSKVEDRVINLADVKPSQKAVRMGKEHGKDPRVMELILKESVKILRAKNGIIVSETRHGLVCANAGVDQSNVKGDSAVLLPVDPDRSASRMKDAVKKKAGKDIVVVITDTFGRPFREGQANVAIGVAGISPIKSYIGSRDMYGRKLRVSEIAIADEIASAAELVMGKAKGVPVAIIRGYEFEKAARSSAKSLQRPRAQDLFR